MDKTVAANIMSRVFIATGFTYFVIGTLLIAAKLSGAISIDNDPVFLIDLYGFVAQMIFGLTYIFVPGLSRTKFVGIKSIAAEYALLNVGIILLESSLLLRLGSPAVLASATAALVAAVLIHAFNMTRIMLFSAQKST